MSSKIHDVTAKSPFCCFACLSFYLSAKEWQQGATGKEWWFSRSCPGLVTPGEILAGRSEDPSNPGWKCTGSVRGHGVQNGQDGVRVSGRHPDSPGV